MKSALAWTVVTEDRGLIKKPCQSFTNIAYFIKYEFYRIKTSKNY